MFIFSTSKKSKVFNYFFLFSTIVHKFQLSYTIFVAVSRRYGSGFSQRPCVCTMSAAFDGRSASCGTAKDQNSTSLVSHRIYLGGCHFNPTSGCQVSEHNMSKWVLMKSLL